MHGIVRILIDLPELVGIDREIGLRGLADRAAGAVPSQAGSWDPEALMAFAQERVRFVLEHRGLPADVVRGATASTTDIVPLRARRVAEALQALRASADFVALAILFKRVKNIAREQGAGGALDRAALTETAEQALLQELDARRPRVEQSASRADYRQALTDVAALRPAVDRFFTEVFVMAEDARLRAARLALMAELRDLILSLADISEIVSQTE
jgi:glycyl-tRNA synthetase beta chain